ncbi:hypothetical protein EDB81DRAFT_771963 [Dactylonectria macrodidyma]|uniref:Uncharacterized protein n=1 Tax=Dactylonectria macrodidyma TaxID=307937 RepID=A0A9P9FTF9_9HYPO|nr:hypothetical protein EDB81DRAFT_771963 [Dactylonectria macrodidyma]
MYPTITSSPPPAIAQRDDECGFQGNPDLYGLGIRLGIYFQWVTVFIVYMWYPEGHKDLWEAYVAFLFSLLVAIIVVTIRAESTYIVEVLVVMYIIFGGSYVIMHVGYRDQHRLRVTVPGWLGMFLTTIVLTAAAIYCSWFWLHGMNTNFLDTPCGSFAFLFAKVSLQNQSVIKFFATISTLLAILSLFTLIAFPILLFRKGKLSFVAPPLADISGEDSEHGATGEVTWRAFTTMDGQLELARKVVYWGLPLVFRFLSPLFMACSLVYSILGIELSLYWNSVTGVNTIDGAGQLIPFVIGLIGLAKVTYLAIRMWYQERYPTSDGDRTVAENNAENQTHGLKGLKTS